MTNNSRIIIVGASSSIGKVVLDQFLSKNFSILATYNNTIPSINLSKLIRMENLDLMSRESLDKFVDEIVPDFGKVDGLVFLTGILPGKSLDQYSDELMQEVMQINLVSQAALLRRLLPYFNYAAQILFVSSIAGDRGSFDPIYAASKAAQNSFVKSLSTWMAPNLRVNAIAPGLVDDTNMFENMSVERREYHTAQTPTKKLTTKKDLAAIILELYSPKWSNFNGQILHINGGSHV